jgi:alpha/beta superfamily hydrolase
MSDGDRTDWRDLPAQMAGMGYMTLAFDFRGRGESQGSFEPISADQDLLAAIAFVHREGASKVVLAGASMGAMASAKATAVEDVAALLFLAGTTSWSGLTVTQEELQASTPKLFISSEGDNYIGGTLQLYEWADPPKEKHIYPGSAHGTDLFNSHGDDLTRRITTFIATHAPP